MRALTMFLVGVHWLSQWHILVQSGWAYLGPDGAQTEVLQSYIGRRARPGEVKGEDESSRELRSSWRR
ncbi:hypothetical protein PR003_g21216 [Phytophthora rubi]|uniref:Uncharacterized protein n=1 Tax=Phytophthora rubi TaxID=129364 RepID=A0A6A3J789_9STRA|nr:hypothetical protein PR002_g21857 [Phytophthora rubi]KAE8992903.1 hypothetical protein PR001_g20813 [Phytophthora rubi]KAE9306543.1 hypothetical protein PR003_g21216 [Phytophthora rubi]